MKRGKIREKLDKRISRFDILDIKLVKWSVVAWTLFLITVWPWLASVVFSVHWAWYLATGILLMIRPMMKYFRK